MTEAEIRTNVAPVADVIHGDVASRVSLPAADRGGRFWKF